MRLHQLTVTAFGPFAGRQRVDFDALAAGGLFLLRGATGAGKSSVLDAVCYALYGELPGSRRASRMRSDHADPQALTEVTLELTLGGRRLEITRLPEQPRPKKRGTGWTTEKPQTLLREWVADAGQGQPGWQAASRSHQETGEEILRLIGMSREQFCQVVLLPQGDFARFLKADATQRAELLGKLFDTERYRRVESWLAERRREHEAAVQADRRRLRELVGRTEQAAGPSAHPAAQWLPADGEAGTDDGAPGPARPLLPGARRRAAVPTAEPTAGVGSGAGSAVGSDLAQAALGWAAVLRADAAEAQTVTAVALAAAETRHRSAELALAEERELAGRQRRHAEALRRSAELARTLDQERAEQQRLTLAQAALTVESALRRRSTAATALLRADQAAQSARRALAPLWSAAGQPGQVGATGTSDTPGAPETYEPPGHVEQLVAAEAAVRAAIGRLESAAADERRVAALTADGQREAAELRRAEETAQEAERWLTAQQAEAEERGQREEAARAAATHAEQLTTQRAEAEQRLAAAHRRDESRTATERAERTLLDQRRRALDAREHGLELRRRRLDGIAAELAAQLRGGQACLVCGSTEHPAPAAPGGTPVRESDERAAAQAQQRAEQAVSAAEAELTRFQVADAAATATAGEQPAAALAEQLDELTGRLREELRTAEQLTVLLQQRERLAEQQQRYSTQLHESRERAAARTARLEALAAERAELTERVAQARGDAPSVAARAERLGRLAQALATAVQALRAAEQAGEQLREAEQELALTARTAGFASPQEAAAAGLPTDQLAALRRRLEERAAERRAVADELARPELVAAATRPTAEPVLAQQALDTATGALRGAAAAEHSARGRQRELADLGRQLATLAADLAPRLTAFGEISRLAQLASGTSGDNRLKMRLESYVLAARLEQVAAAASARLVRMSGGRYTLVHSDERGPGGRRSGLSLLVVDAWTGTERDTATLSGGESFFASLALALGLADVVTDEAGGMPLDTLFIDEGFGTLDEQALEEVMDVLDGLRERDRAVGIVSHVADLRQRVPAQLLVRKTRHGSTLHLTGPDAG
ncbi:AAA family ATPase [Kitasatospora kifunensis]|uniref:Nuclease SbcCD subunit C n=1 Tax=Kitasatospora kifunensis TaxID=58351 RepID=A0A7W7R711_KITKI|nr:SMC family ATPase [Kitasatospora kifunensis]MBB4926587.1 exonuclease SbcC [Kitasatospora kifunensis]